MVSCLLISYLHTVEMETHNDDVPCTTSAVCTHVLSATGFGCVAAGFVSFLLTFPILKHRLYPLISLQ